MAAFLLSSKHRITVRSALNLALLLVAAVFFAFHAVHIDADFPNHSPWMDWSKYTDEGWYGDAAIRHFQRGHWYVPGDFNPGVALPVWPFLESLAFYFTGVTLTAARALTVAAFALILIASYLLLRRSFNLSQRTSGTAEPALNWSNGPAPLTWIPAPTTSLAPAIAVLLLAVSPFCFVFTRLAILEPLLVLFTLLALLATSYIQPPNQPSGHRFKHLLPSILLGVLVPLMVLTKTTAVFLLPAIAWLLWARAGYRLRPFIRVSIVPAAIAATLWLTYYLALVRPRFLDDYRYLFAANAYTGITAATAISIFSDTIRDGVWMGRLIFPLSLLAILVAVLNPRLSRRNPLIPALVFWAAGYAIFLAYHNNLQPRYYLVIAVPLTLLVPAVFAELWRADAHPPTARHPQLPARPIAGAALALALIFTVVLDARQTLSYVRAPEYTFINAADQIQQIITADQRKNPTHNPLVLSISGSNLSLMTGLPSICDDFGTMQLGTRVATYRPGWFLTWNHVEDDKMEALAPYFHLQRVAEFPVMDDPERNLLILYRLDPPIPNTPLPPPRQHPPIPRLLRTKLGQQPSVTQLQH
jgi:4-amino-4-deoxy-L-arabinose transferase-like glycosyltransferase